MTQHQTEAMETVRERWDREQFEIESYYAAAADELKEGGKLLVWAGGDAPNQQEALQQKFADRFPKVPIEIKVDLSKFHDIRIYQELLDGHLTPDVTMLQTVNDFEDWKNMGVLEAFKPTSYEGIREGFVDTAGYYSGLFLFSFQPQVARSVKPFPVSYEEFLTADFGAHLVLTYPQDDDAVLYMYDKIIGVKGWDFVRAIAARQPRLLRGTAAPAALVGQEGYLGNLTGYPMLPDDPSQAFIPTDAPFITWAQTGAMFRLTKHKAAARLFLAYLTSHEFQESLGSFSIRKDTALPAGQAFLMDRPNTDPYDFISWIKNREHIHELRQQMAKIFGPVEGVSPLEDPELLKLYK